MEKELTKLLTERDQLDEDKQSLTESKQEVEDQLQDYTTETSHQVRDKCTSRLRMYLRGWISSSLYFLMSSHVELLVLYNSYLYVDLQHMAWEGEEGRGGGGGVDVHP